MIEEPVAIIENSMNEWSGNVSVVLFYGKCNVSCFYCHNKGLMGKSPLPEGETRRILEKNRRYATGVVLTGGECTEHDIEPSIDLAREMGIKVKLHTNGTNPERLSRYAHKLDCLAMDIKFARTHHELFGWNDDLESRFLESLKILNSFQGETECHCTLSDKFFDNYVFVDYLSLLDRRHKIFIRSCDGTVPVEDRAKMVRGKMGFRNVVPQ